MGGRGGGVEGILGRSRGEKGCKVSWGKEGAVMHCRARNIFHQFLACQGENIKEAVTSMGKINKVPCKSIFRF